MRPRSIHIDGHEISYQEGQTVLQAALAAGLAIPHLCYHPELTPIGSCRLCLVEVAGRKFSACTLLAEAGLSVQSDSLSLRKLRTALVTMLFEKGNHTCIRCERTGNCRLQDAAVLLDVSAVESPSDENIPLKDDSHPDVALDRSHCILCGICIQASQKLDRKNIFAFGGNGGGVSLLVESTSGLLKDSAIAAEDHAVRLCPVGALTRKHSPAQNGFSSFDSFDPADWSG